MEGVDLERVTGWFRANVPASKPPFRVEMIKGGHSNLTFKLTDAAGVGWVLRRPPLGHVLESAHDMGREHRIVSALGPTDVPVAPVHGLCTDPQVNDAPFYVMSFVSGIVPADSAAGGQIDEADRHPLGIEIVDNLARLHALDPDAVGLGELGRKEGYVARQLRRWSKQWQGSKTRELPEMDEAQRLLEQHMPEQIGASIVHGDYRIGNMIVQGRSVEAVLDWELCTLGDPLADVGYLLNNWLGPEEAVPGSRETTATTVGGFPARDELCEHYERASGRDVSRIAYYRAFSHWRSAAIVEGVYARYLHGAMGRGGGVDPAQFADNAPRSASAALDLLATL